MSVVIVNIDWKKANLLQSLGQIALLFCLLKDVRSGLVENNVNFVGTCSRQVVAETLQNSKLFLLTSVSEGFPKVLLEALACGTPVVATDTGSCREVASDAGIIVQPKNVEEITNAISRLTIDTVYWQKCSRNAISKAKQYTWKRTAAIVLNIYQQNSSR